MCICILPTPVNISLQLQVQMLVYTTTIYAYVETKHFANFSAINSSISVGLDAENE